MAKEVSAGFHEDSGQGKMIKTLTNAHMHFRIHLSAAFPTNKTMFRQFSVVHLKKNVA